jgi:xanthine dehydrogenase accessory factor
MQKMLDSRYFEHPADVLEFARIALSAGRRTALVVVTSTVGGGMRTAGTLVAVTHDGQMSGYVSNGCVDADVVVQAQLCMQEGKVTSLRYGQGSPFFDIILPCGGAIDLLVFPISDTLPIQNACRLLRQRQPVTLVFDAAQKQLTCQDADTSQEFNEQRVRVDCFPKPRIRVVGQGASVMAVAHHGIEAGFEIIAQSPSQEELAQLENAGAIACDHLLSPQHPPLCNDDKWTAVLMLFHDHDWEVSLILETLKKDAFFIGAMGSTKTQHARIEALTEAGVGMHDLSRIIGPLGLVPSLRDAKQIAISTLAQVVNLSATQSLPVQVLPQVA